MPHIIHCKGKNCDANTSGDNPEYVELRYDAYGYATGYYCDNCYENNYPYRNDNYFTGDTGERLEDDY